MKQKQLFQNWTLPAIVAALYVALSLLLAPLSFNAIQIRFAELFNHLVAFNKRYILAITLGCFITNLFSPLGMADLIFGTAGTLIGTSLTWYFGHRATHKLSKYCIATLSQLPGTFLVAWELNIVSHAPLLWTWFTVAVGEMLSMIIGAIIVNLLTTRIDFVHGRMNV